MIDWNRLAIAKAALTGILAYPGDSQGGSAYTNSTPKDVARGALAYADALIEAVREEVAEPAACELKPCPFCGADGTIVQADNDVAWYIVECAGTINCAMRPRCESDSYDALVSAWNTRAVERRVKAELMGGEE